MMKNRPIAALLFWLSLGLSPVAGQVAIVEMPGPGGRMAIEDVWRVSLLSAGAKPVAVRLEVTVETGQHEEVLAAASPVFTLQPGANRPSFGAAGGGSFQFGTGRAAQAVRGTGRFPYGEYIICYRAIAASNGAEVGQLCQERTVAPSSPPELVVPPDGAEVEAVRPFLAWRGPLPPGDRVEYALFLKEIKDGQDREEALEANRPILQARGLQGTFLPFPADVPPLEAGKKYAWQVAATEGGYDLGSTEIWVFEVKADRLQPPLDESYRVLGDARELPRYSCGKGFLSFAYLNRSGFSDLSLTAQSAGQTDKHEIAFPKTPLKAGLNKIALPLGEVNGLKKGERYILFVKNDEQNRQLLEFFYEG